MQLLILRLLPTLPFFFDLHELPPFSPPPSFLPVADLAFVCFLSPEPGPNFLHEPQTPILSPVPCPFGRSFSLSLVLK